MIYNNIIVFSIISHNRLSNANESFNNKLQWFLFKSVYSLFQYLWKLKIISLKLSIFFFHHTTCESTCDTLASSATNQGDNTVSVAQGFDN